MLNVRDHIINLRPSETLTINQQSIERIKSGLETYKFGFGQSPFPVPQIVQEALRANTHQKDYLPVQGLLTLRQEVAEHTNQLIGSHYNADEVFIGPGSKELIYLMQLIIDAPLLVPSPSWVSYIPQAILAKKNYYQIDTQKGNWTATAENIENTLKYHRLTAGMLLLNYPSNPTGRTFSIKDLESIAKVCRNYGLIVISDEIYGRLTFSGEYRSIAQYYPEGTIICSGLSKWCGAGGWRLGTAIIPHTLYKLHAAMRTVASETFSAVSAPIQYAACSAFIDTDDLTKYLQSSRSILSQVADYCHDQLATLHVPITKAEGGFYLFPDFTDIINDPNMDASTLCKHLLRDTGVALLPGTAFGRPPSELTARLSFVDFNGEKALNAHKQDTAFTGEEFADLFPNIIKGMNRLTEWLKKQSYLATPQQDSLSI